MLRLAKIQNILLPSNQHSTRLYVCGTDIVLRKSWLEFCGIQRMTFASCAGAFNPSKLTSLHSSCNTNNNFVVCNTFIRLYCAKNFYSVFRFSIFVSVFRNEISGMKGLLRNFAAQQNEQEEFELLSREVELWNFYKCFNWLHLTKTIQYQMVYGYCLFFSLTSLDEFNLKRCFEIGI